MNQNDIRMFLTIAKIGSLNQAASHLFVTQPALSQQLKSLETELGTTLFLRKQGQRNLTLTASGRGFYEIAVKMDALFQESMQVRYLEDVRSLSIHTVGSLNSHLLNPLYQRLSSMTPPIALKLATGKTHIIYQSIADHSYMLADSTKFEGASPVRVCGIDEVDAIVTDSGLDDMTLQLYSDKQATVVK